jgi:putative ABC transport system ATP-binding protein
MSFLKIDNLKKYYFKDGLARLIIDIPHFHLNQGEQIVLVGKSGTGKSTLLHLIAGLTQASEGTFFIDGVAIHQLSETKRDAFRGKNIGMIFQTYHLLPGLTALENVQACEILNGNTKSNNAREILTRLGLADRLNDLPETLSSGQQQRVAIARALCLNPKILLADEPTAGLDHDNAIIVLNLLKEECQRLNACLILVTHDEFAKKQFTRNINLSELSKGVYE